MFLYFNSTAVRKTFYIALFICASLIPATISAAEIQVAPENGTYNIGQTFTVSVQVVPGGSAVNAVEARLQFDPEIISVVGLAKNETSFSRWTTEPTYSNSSGTIQFGSVSEAPFTTAANVLQITFRALAPGSGGVAVSAASVYATDGLRTDVFSGAAPAMVTISSVATAVERSVTDEENTTEINADRPTVQSEVFSDSTAWHNTATGVFAWDVPAGTTAVAVEIANTPTNRPNNNPEAIVESPVSEFLITSDMVVDGVQYLSLRFRDEDGWGQTLNQKILIDTTPPETFSIAVQSVSDTSFPRIWFEAIDLTSGVVYYEITIPGKESVTIEYADAKFGYQLSELKDGVYDITVTAYDAAGNSRISTTSVPIAAGWTEQVSANENIAFETLSLSPGISIFILAVIIILLLFYIHLERQKLTLKEAKITRETFEIQEKMEKIFSALRDEIYDQIVVISKRKRLTKAEKEVVEGLNQAIKVSEALLEKEIDDVKKLLK